MLKVITAAVKSSVKIFTVIGCVINRPRFKNRLLCVCVGGCVHVCVCVLSFLHTQWKEKSERLRPKIHAEGRVHINCKFNPFYDIDRDVLVFF